MLLYVVDNRYFFTGKPWHGGYMLYTNTECRIININNSKCPVDIIIVIFRIFHKQPGVYKVTDYHSAHFLYRSFHHHLATSQTTLYDKSPAARGVRLPMRSSTNELTRVVESLLWLPQWRIYNMSCVRNKMWLREMPRRCYFNANYITCLVCLSSPNTG